MIHGRRERREKYGERFIIWAGSEEYRLYYAAVVKDKEKKG